MWRVLRWLWPGLGLKRWALLVALGIFLTVVGITFAIPGEFYLRVENLLRSHLYAGLQANRPARWAAVVFLAGLGTGLSLFGMAQMVRAVLHTLLPATGERVRERYMRRQGLIKGPRVVAVGGGTGLPNLLRGLKELTANLGAVVTVADDGGSSGRLRDQFGILPPGDIRNCLVALADTEPLLERLFQHRFTTGGGLDGHSFGNLFLLALTDVTGDFQQAIQACSEVLAVRGSVYPSTLQAVQLQAELADGRTVQGESAIRTAGAQVRRVSLAPPDAAAVDEALAALAAADLVVLGPGSLYTSILPNLLVPGVAEAIRHSSALKVYVCNIMTEPGETDGYTAAQHLQVIHDHVGPGLVNVCLVNNGPIPPDWQQRYAIEGAHPVAVDAAQLARLGVQVVQANVVEIAGQWLRHSPVKLAAALGRLLLHGWHPFDRPPWAVYLLRERLRLRA